MALKVCWLLLLTVQSQPAGGTEKGCICGGDFGAAPERGAA